MKSGCRNLLHFFGTVILLLLATLPVLPSMAADPNAGQPEARRYFGGHQFIPSTTVPDPFITTTLTNTTGFGQASNIAVPIRNLDGDQIGELNGDIAFLFLEFGYQQSFGERFAVRVGASGGARAGTSAEAILAEGLSSIYGYALGGSASLVQKRNWQLTGTLDLRSNTLYGVSPGAFLRSVREQILAGDSTDVPTDSLLSSGSNLRALAGLRAAWTPTPSLGVTAFFESGLGERFEEGDDNLAVVNTGAAVSFDLNPLNRWPLGFVMSVRHESISERGDDLGGSANTIGLGLFYTGRRHFVVGLDNTWGRIARDEIDGKIDTFQGRILLRYDFN